MIEYLLSPLIAGGFEIMGLILLCSFVIWYFLCDTYLKINCEYKAIQLFKEDESLFNNSFSGKSLIFPILQDLKTQKNQVEQGNLIHKKLIGVLPHIERKLKIAEAVVQAAPLLGLLGTVSGMILTFDALRTYSNANGLLAEGIARALYTTEFGLLVAIPGVFFSFLLQQKINALRVECRVLMFSNANAGEAIK